MKISTLRKMPQKSDTPINERLAKKKDGWRIMVRQATIIDVNNKVEP